MPYCLFLAIERQSTDNESNLYMQETFFALQRPETGKTASIWHKQEICKEEQAWLQGLKSLVVDVVASYYYTGKDRHNIVSTVHPQAHMLVSQLPYSTTNIECCLSAVLLYI